MLAAVRPQPGQEDGWAPPPGLSGLGELLAQVRAAGLTVTARTDGAPADLPAGLDLAAYRIVQEALTNTLKHARAQAAEVNLRYRPAGLLLEVTDDGQPAAPAGPRGTAPGRGLIGIRERAALHGGTCQAGPRPGGGFAVRVSLPLDASGRAGTVASGTAPMSPRQTAALKETALSRTAQPDPRSRPRWRRWLLIAGDAALALALAAVAVAEPWPPGPGRAVGIALALLQTLPLAVRRWRPVGVLAVVAAATLGTAIARDGGDLGPVCVLVALYSVAAHCPRRQAAWAGIAAWAVLTWPLLREGGGPGGPQQIGLAAAISLGFPALAWLSGAYVSELRARAARSRREQELETGRAVAEEQARVGRELHDVIAHTLSVIVIQAGAAQDVFGTSPQAARQALGAIGAAGRQALAELRRVLAAVRPQPGQEEDGWAPPPGLSGLGELLAQVRAAGLTVTARIDGAPADLPAGLDLAAYRIVQEALTNTLKHARAQAAEVNLRYRPAGLLLEVTDDGQPAVPAGPARDHPGPGADRHPRARGAARRDLSGRAAPRRGLRGPGQPPAARGRAVMTIRVLLCDDQALVRGGFRMILEARPDLQVVGEAEDGRQAVSLARQTQPDVILMDVRMPNLDGVEATRQIVAGGSPARILMLTTYDLDEYVYAAIRAGASGFLLKDVQPAQLAEAIRVIAAGDALLAPSVTRRLLGQFARTLPAQRATPASLSALTERETEVLRLLAAGLSNAELAGRLYISEATVKSHVSSLLRKLGLRDRVQAVILAYDAGLVTPQQP